MNTLSAVQYETVELRFAGNAPEGPQVEIDLAASFEKDGTVTAVKGFYAGDGEYRVRFLPEKEGNYAYSVKSDALGIDERGTLAAAPAMPGHHGPVRPKGRAMYHADGTWFASFGTTVYALANQSSPLIEETLETLSRSPFNKIRTCVFPKHYAYNANNPALYPFEVKEGREIQTFSAEGLPIMPYAKRKDDDYWDTEKPCFAFWDHLEDVIRRLGDLGIQVDLILFHPYDRWGFSSLSRKDNLRYLDYLLRRLSAYDNVWWSLANEYDLCFDKSEEDFKAFEAYVAANDPYRHPLSNHNCFAMWDAGSEDITHVSFQTKELNRVAELLHTYNKPVFIDECRYEGNVPEFWGNLSGQEMMRSFWRVVTQGGYCTHGETFLPDTKPEDPPTMTGETDVVWWAKGGRLRGESPDRIAFLREIVESLPGPIEPMEGELSELAIQSDEAFRETISHFPPDFQDFLSAIARMDETERKLFYAVEYSYKGHCGTDAYLYYLDDQCAAYLELNLPEENRYRIEVIDPWEMTRTAVRNDACGTVRVPLSGKPYLAVLAVIQK